MRNNLVMMSDSYKVSHWLQFPKGTENTYYYFTSRGGEFGEIVFAGLQHVLKSYLEGRVVTREKIEYAEDLIGKHINPDVFNGSGWRRLQEKHGGNLPVSIRAVPEGTICHPLDPLFTIENTDPDFWWLPGYLETLLVQTWYPTTVASLSRKIKQIIHSYLVQTGDPSLIDFKLHDFGFRGVSSPESAGIGGLAHLFNFLGTDTMAALIVGKDYYDSDCAGYSIPASEHSTITSWGREGEADAHRNMLYQFPSGLVASVSDSWDFHNCCRKIWGEELKEEVLRRDGTVVIRPDSGDPETVVVEGLTMLGESFGFTVNEKGFRVLNPKVRLIQGDGITLKSIPKILNNMKKAGWSADNITFGMGGGLLQQVNRDTCRFALKCSSIRVDGIERDVFKQPVGCDWKASVGGRFDLPVEVFRDGEILVRYSLDQCRELAKI